MSLGFDPNSNETQRSLILQIREWGSGYSYCVVGDAGPCIIAAFAFTRHAQEFAKNCGQDFAYACNDDGLPVVRAKPQLSALERFHQLGGDEEADPLERLRFFCSLAMHGTDWLDVEQFFDALAAATPEPQGSGGV